MTQSPSTGIDLVKEAKTIINEREFSRYPEIISGSYVQYTPGSLANIHGPAGLQDYHQAFLAGFPDYEFTSVDIMADEDIVMEEWELTGTHDGEYMGIPPTHNEVEFRTMAKYIIKNGNIEEEYGYFDPQEFLSQLDV